MNISITLDIAQLLLTIVGAVYALIQLRESNLEKKNMFYLSIYDHFYNDPDINKIVYVTDKEKEEDLCEIRFDGKLEKEIDKTLRLLQLIGQLMIDKQIKIEDFPCQYEISTILNNEYVEKYIAHLEINKINTNNLHLLKSRLNTI